MLGASDSGESQTVPVTQGALAILGGVPRFPEAVHVGRPNVGDRDAFLARVNEMLDRRWFTNAGPFCKELEERIADYLGVKHCIAMCNATIALEIAARAANLSGEVIVPAFTFVATAHALQWQQITPVFCDMDPRTHQMDASKVEALITPRTTGIIGVHVWGRTCDVEALSDIAERHGLALMFDAAHAFACSRKGQLVGGFGNAEVFSFHATKFFNTFEGGAVTTNDDDFATRIRLMRNFGFSGMDRVIHVGTNGKMSEVCAAMGLAGLDRLDSVIEVNRRNYDQYRERLADLPGVVPVEYDAEEACNYQYVVFEIDPEVSPLTRDELVEVLHAENVLARRYFWPGVHRMEPYRSFFPHAHLLLPETERVASRITLLPTGTMIDERDIDAICAVVVEAMRRAPAVRKAIRQAGLATFREGQVD
jgi:dTDP-4-amino-4,6-dideoxygalactose transaminase